MNRPDSSCGCRDDAGHSRPRFWPKMPLGLGGVALACLLGEEPRWPIPPANRSIRIRLISCPGSRILPRAKAMISLFMQGGPSQVDLLDPKPELTRLTAPTMPPRSNSAA